MINTQSPYRLAPMFNFTIGGKSHDSFNKTDKKLLEEDYEYSNLLSPLMDVGSKDEYQNYSITGGFNKSKDTFVTEASIVNTEESMIKIKVYLVERCKINQLGEQYICIKRYDEELVIDI
jgi:hypothetical protein